MAPARLPTREVTLRTAAVAALAGLALVLAIELPWAFAQARHLGVLAAAAIATCLALGAALTMSTDPGAPAAWRSLGALGAAVLAVWGATRAVAVPGLGAAVGQWTAAPGLAACGLAAGCLALAAAGAGLRLRAPAVALAVGLALAPGTGALLVALGPGPTGGEKTISGAATAHVHATAAQGSFRPGFGGHAGHYVYPNARPPRLPSWGLALAVGLAVGATYLAAGALQRRRIDGDRRLAVARGVPA